MITHFEKVTLYSTLKGKCSVCGKYCKRTKEFMQTLNPWNQIAGRPKTESEILTELHAERREWASHGPRHEKCEREQKRAEVASSVSAGEGEG
jgi:hypothetical protein